MADSDIVPGADPSQELPIESGARSERVAASFHPALATVESRIGVSLESGPHVLELIPGQAAIVEVTLTNHGSFADTLTLAIDGLPEEWVTVPLMRILIEPERQLTVPLIVTVPTGSEGRAGVYQVIVRASSSVDPNEPGEMQACWIVRPFIAAQLSVTPRQQRGRRQALFTISVTNLGNAPARYTLSAEDDQQALDISLDQPAAMVEPGHTLHAPLLVRAESQRFTDTAHILTVRAEAPGLATQTARAKFIQAPLVPLWVPGFVLLALLVLLCGLGRLPLALAGGLPFYGALVALPSPTTTANAMTDTNATVVADLATAQGDTQRTALAMQAALAALQTAVADVPSVAQRAARTAVAAQLPPTTMPAPTATPPPTLTPTRAPAGEPPPDDAGLPPPSDATAGPEEQPTDEALPTEASPTATPVPTATSSPTATPSPTATSSPTATPLPELEINDVAIKEGDSGTSTIIFSVQLSQLSDQTVTVNYQTTDGSARASVDYIGASGTLTFEPGTSIETFSIAVIGNTKVDGDRTFNVTLSSPDQASISKKQGIGTIVDDDQTIAFGPLPNKKLGDPPFTIGATASSGLPVSFLASGACTVDGAIVTLTAAGQCIVTASQSGNYLFNPAPPVSQTFTINP